MDLLGDDVDALSDLLEQVDEKLSQFQPVLVHYPGVRDDVHFCTDLGEVLCPTVGVCWSM